MAVFVVGRGSVCSAVDVSVSDVPLSEGGCDRPWASWVTGSEIFLVIQARHCL